MRARPQLQRWSDERGYLMVALLVAMSVMAIMMTAAMPAWHTLVQREKETELVFRGEQIARAIGLYQRRFANAPAPSLDALVEQRFLRKKYKDPITNDDFQVLSAGANLPGRTTAPGGGAQTQSGSQQGAGRAGGTATTTSTQGRGSGGTLATGFGGATAGGVIGVTSKSSAKSLRLYNGQDTYNQWIFMPVARAGGAGAGGAGAGGARTGGAGGRGADGRGGRGPADGRGFDGGRGPQPPQGGRGTQPPQGRF